MNAYNDTPAFLATCRQGWEEAGHIDFVWQAFTLCMEEGLTLPKWLADATGTILFAASRPGAARWWRDQIHVHRWRRVKQLRQCSPSDFQAAFGMRKTWVNTYELVVDMDIAPRSEPVSAEAIKASYQLVERAVKSGKFGRFAAHFQAPSTKTG